MNDNRVLVDTNLKKIGRMISDGDYSDCVESMKILEQTIEPARKLYYHTGLNSDREALFMCYSYYAYANEIVYNEKDIEKYLNTSLVYYNNAVGLREEIKKKTIQETRDMYELYDKIVELSKSLKTITIDEDLIKMAKPAYKFYKKTKNVEDLIHYLGILEYSALIYQQSNQKKKAIKVYLKCIKIAKDILKITKNENDKRVLIMYYQTTLALMTYSQNQKLKAKDRKSVV